MSDLIKKRDAIEALNAVDVYGDGIGFEVLSHAIRDVSLLPTVDAVPVEFIKGEIKDNKGFYNSSLRRLLDVWAERKEE